MLLNPKSELETSWGCRPPPTKGGGTRGSVPTSHPGHGQDVSIELENTPLADPHPPCSLIIHLLPCAASGHGSGLYTSEGNPKLCSWESCGILESQVGQFCSSPVVYPICPILA